MKKLVLFALLTVLVASSLAMNVSKANERQRPSQVSGLVIDEAKNLSQSKEDVVISNEFLDSFDKSSNGYGWYGGSNAKIAYDPATGIYGGSYRAKFSTEITGTIGGYVYTEGELEKESLLDESSEPGYEDPRGRYPHTAGANGHIFAFYNDYWNLATNSNALMNVYSAAEEEWTSYIKIANEDGETPPGAWSGHGDATYNAEDGMYYVVSTWGFNGNNGMDARDECFVVGKTDDPLGDWEFSSYSDNQFKVTEMAGVTDLSDLSFKFGTGGFGFLSTVISEVENGASKVAYRYTTDYGQTWNETGTPALPFATIDGRAMMPFTDQMSSGAEPIPMNDPSCFYNTDVVVTDNNTVHIVSRWAGGSSTNNSVYFASEDQICYSFYDLVGTLGEDGFTWEANFIANPAGLATEGGPEFKYSNRHTISIGAADDNNIYVSWLDRPVDGAVDSPWGQNGTDTGTAHFIDDVFMTVSHDAGKTWEGLEDATVEFSDHDPYPVKYATNVTNTPNLHEEGYVVADKASIDAKGSMVVYGAFQYYDAENPLAPPVERFGDHEQFLYVMKTTVPAFGSSIESEITSLVKDFSLEQNYPNPFNPSTSINFKLQTAANVELAVFNTAGQEIAQLVNDKVAAGTHSVNFNAANLNSGVYFYQLKVNGMSEMRKMVLTK